MKIVNYIKESFQECYPFDCSLVLFSQGCNLACDLCKGYNYETVINPENIIGDAISIIKENTNPMIDSVVFLGGEPTIWGEDLIKALKYCKNNGLKTKVFTNGMRPDIVKEICLQKLGDAWSVDYKGIPEHIAPFIGEKAEDYKTNLYQTLECIIKSRLPLEIRTTFFDKNIQDKDEIKSKIYSIQKKMGTNYPYFEYIEQEDARKLIKQA